MIALADAPPAGCPKCGADFHDCFTAQIIGSVDAEDDPEGVARIDANFSCSGCGAVFNAFVAVPDLVTVVEGD